MPKKARGLFEEVFTFSISLGGTSNVLVSTLSNRPPRSSFRPIRAEIQFSGAYVPGSNDRSGYFAPAGLQMTFNNPAGEHVATSEPMLACAETRRVQLRYPGSADYWSYDHTGSAVFATINAICVGLSGGTNASVRGICKLWCRCGPELTIATCPTLLTGLDRDDETPTASGYVVIE